MNSESPSLFENIRFRIREKINLALEQRSRPSSPILSTSCSAPRSSAQRSSESEDEGKIVSMSDSDSSDKGSSHPLFLSEETEHVKVVRSTMGIKDPKEPFSIQDKIFQSISHHIGIKKMSAKE